MGSDKKIKICHLISGDLWAGAETQMFTTMQALHEEGEFNLSAIVLNAGKLAQSLKEAGITTTVIDESHDGFVKILNKISTLLDESQVDILHTHRYKENILGALLKKRQKVGHLVQTVHGINENLHGLKFAKMNIYSSWNRYFTKRYFDKVITVSRQLKTELKGKTGDDHLVTIHNCIDIDRIAVCKSRNKIRRELGIEENAILIGSAGRMVPIKGYEIFLKMATVLSARDPNIRFILVGDGPSKQQIQSEILRLGLSDKVIMPGFRDDIYDILNAIDIFVLSSHHEGVPIVLLEAMALGKAVVSTTVGGIPEIIQNAESGILVNDNDYEALAESCLMILNSPDLKANLECKAKARIAEEFSVDIHRKRISALYQELVKSP